MSERRYIHEMPAKGFENEFPSISTFRDCTPEEIADAEAFAESANHLRQQIASIERALAKYRSDLESLKRNCPHTAQWDEDSFLYTTRTCLACGRTSLL